MPRKIILYTAVSIDGLIARNDGSVDWLDPYAEAPDDGDYGYKKFIEGIDTTIMGHETYEMSMKLGGPSTFEAFRTYVLTRKNSHPKDDRATFLSDNIPVFIRSLKSETGKDIWLLGGGQTNSFLLSHRLIDTMILSVIPVVLGEGIPLFSRPSEGSSFTLSSEKHYSNGVVQLRYDTLDTKVT